MDRNKASKEYKWDLTDIYKNLDDFYIDLENLEQNYKKYADFKGKLGDFNQIFQYFIFNEHYSKTLEKVYCYVYLNHDIDLDNSLFTSLLERINLLIANISLVSAYIEPELASLSNDYYQTLLLKNEFKDYEYKIKNILLRRKYILSEQEEIALSTTAKYSNGFSEIYEAATQSDFKFKPVIVNGKSEELTQSTYAKFIESKNSDIRAQAYNNLYEVFNQFSKTLSYNYINFVKMVSADIELRKAKSVFNYSFYSEQISEDIFNCLVKNVNNNLSLEHKYFELLKNVLKLDNFGFQDIYQTLSPNFDKTWGVDEQKTIVLNALKPLGEDYQQILTSAYSNNWIDYYANSNKKSGGYMLGVYGVHPYILLNDHGGYDSLSTLAHELGHACHTYYSNLNQPYAKHDYTTFIAEIASTVNEILLNKCMTKNATSKEEKLFYLNHYLQAFKGTVFRQTMFAEFENFAFKKAESNQLLTHEILDNEYKLLLEKHFSNIVNIDNNIIHEWLRIPHFYSPYYVFQYSTSFICAVYIANNILEGKNDMLKKYKDLISSGCNGYPTDLLNQAGLNLLNDELYKYSFNDMKNTLKEVEKLLK